MKTRGFGRVCLIFGLSLSYLLSSAPVYAQDDAGLGVTLDTTYTSKYIWRGHDLFDDHAAIQPSVNWDIFDTGFSANVWGSLPMGSGSEDLTELDYTLAYGTTIFEDAPYAVDLGVNYIYYDFPKVNSRAIPDTQEVGVSVSLPNLIELGGIALAPSYYAGKLWPTDSDIGFDVAGGYHSFGLGCEIAVPETEWTVELSGDLNYNDGLFGADHDWSHATLGVAMNMELWRFAVRPFLNYQISMENSVNTEDELYGGVSLAMEF